MARIRSIHPGLATDEAYMAMSAYAKAAWPNIWTECDDQGAFEWKPIVLKARLLPADTVDMSALLEEWVTLGAVKRVEIDGRQVGLVRNFCRFQRPKKPKYMHVIPAEYRTFVGLTTIGGEISDRHDVIVEDEWGTCSELSPQMEDVGGNRKEVTSLRSVKKALLAENEKSWELFRSAYPKRDGDQDWKTARQRFDRQIAGGADPQTIIAGTRGYAEKMRASGNEGTAFVKQAATFLNKEIWREYAGSDATKMNGNGHAVVNWESRIAYAETHRGAWMMDWGSRSDVPTDLLDRYDRAIAMS